MLVLFEFLLLNTSADVGWEDSGELTTASYLLSISHPTGFPLYIQAVRMMLYFPVGTLAYRANLFSALAGAGAVLLLYVLVSQVTQKRTLAGLAVLIFAMTPHFLLQAAIAEIYTFQVLGLSLIIYFLLVQARAMSGGDSGLRYFLLIFFLGAFFSGIQPIFFLIVAALMFSAFWKLADKRLEKIPVSYSQLLLIGLVLLILGLSINLYLPIRGKTALIYHWGPLLTFPDVWGHLTAAEYRIAFPELKFLPQQLVLGERLKLFISTLQGTGFKVLWPVCFLGLLQSRQGVSLRWPLFLVLCADVGYTIMINPMGMKTLQTSLITLFCGAYFFSLGAGLIIERIWFRSPVNSDQRSQ